MIVFSQIVVKARVSDVVFDCRHVQQLQDPAYRKRIPAQLKHIKVIEHAFIDILVLSLPVLCSALEQWVKH